MKEAWLEGPDRQIRRSNTLCRVRAYP
jgi:hypothetical protein